MPQISKDSIVFQFMLKEYEKLYGKFDMHYQAVEKSINFYFVLIGAVISFNGLVYTKFDGIEIFNLSGFQIIFLMILCLLGFLVFFKVIEHRLLIIAYVKSLNLNRKWFLENSEDKNLSSFLYFKADVSEPKFFKPFRHFYWESTGLAAINSIFCALFIINLVIRTKFFYSQNSVFVNSLLFVFLFFSLIYFHILYYKLRGEKEEKKVQKRLHYT